MSESLISKLGELPVAEPDGRRTEHIRRRCHARLARHARRSCISPTATSRDRVMPVWQSLIALLGVVYLTGAIRFALALYN